MATSKVIRTTYKPTKVKNPKTGKVKTKMTKTKTVDTFTNVGKGAGSRESFRTDAARIKAKQIQSNENVQLAKIKGRATNVATIGSNLSATAMSGFGKIAPQQTSQIREIKASNNAVDQAINGGVVGTSSNSRNDEDDEEDNPYID